MDSARERTSLTRVLFSMVLASVLMVAGADAWAQQGDAAASEEEDKPWHEGVPLERRQAARAVFLEGNEFIKDTLFAKAADKYKQAIAIWGHPAFHYNLAIAQINLDQPIEAYRSLKEAMRYGEAPLGSNRYEQTQNYLKLLEKQLGRLEVVCDDAGAEVTLDGKPLFVGPGRHQGLVQPGAHQLVAGKTGYLTWSEPVVVSSGEHRRIEVTLVTLDQVSESSRRWATWKPWAVVGGGAAVALAGGVVHWRAAANFAEYDRQFLRLECVEMPDEEAPGCAEVDVPGPLQDRLRRATWEQRIAVASYAVGGAALAAGFVLVYLNRPRLAEDAEGKRPANISISPVMTPQTAGMTATVRF